MKYGPVCCVSPKLPLFRLLIAREERHARWTMLDPKLNLIPVEVKAFQSMSFPPILVGCLKILEFSPSFAKAMAMRP